MEEVRCRQSGSGALALVPNAIRRKIRAPTERQWKWAWHDDDPAPRPAVTLSETYVGIDEARGREVRGAGSGGVGGGQVGYEEWPHFLHRSRAFQRMCSVDSVAASAELETGRRRYPMSLEGWAMRHSIRRIARKD